MVFVFFNITDVTQKSWTCDLLQERHDDTICANYSALNQLSDQPDQLYT